ncbi:MAG: YdcF family protein [Planctomycetes bacterium]|nr:YdcF family protein [Planctomycetota bacterium]
MLILVIAAVLLIARSAMLWRDRHERDWRWWAGWSVPVVALVVVVVQLERLEALGPAIAVKKFVAHLVMPAGVLWLALAAGAVWAVVRHRRRHAVVWTVLFVLHGLAGNMWFGAWLMRGLEVRVAATDVRSAGPYEAVFVCGGGTSAGSEGRSEVACSGDRVLYAAELYLQGAARILVSSSSSLASMEDARDLSEETASIWRRLGIPAGRIVTLPEPRVTGQEIIAYRDLAERSGWSRVGLVTSAWHMPRAQRLCARAGFAVDPLPCDHRGRMPPFSPIWLIPQEKGFQRVQLALWEYLGLLAGG